MLAAAYEVFGERGIAATSLQEVAASAGLTKGAVYSSFASKDELVLVLMQEHGHHRLAAAVEAFTHAGDPATAMAEVGRVLTEEMHRDAAWHRLLAEYYALSNRSPEIRDALRARRRTLRREIVAAIEAVTAAHDLDLLMPAEELATVLMALSNGLAVESGIDPDVPDHLLARVLTLLEGRARRS